MGLFKKKKETVEIPVIVEPPPCQHKWKDFDWYLDYSINYTYNRYGSPSYTLNYTIYEPYICVLCKKRENVTLVTSEIQGSRDVLLAHAEKIAKRYPKIKDRPIIEDEIQDFLRVDREYLKIYDNLHGEAKVPKIKE